MKAKFIGTSSCGFIKNSVYEITSTIHPVFVKGKRISCICIHDAKSAAHCPYSSLESFLSDWRLLDEYDDNGIVELLIADIHGMMEQYLKFTEIPVLQQSTFERMRQSILAEHIINSQQRVIESLQNTKNSNGFAQDDVSTAIQKFADKMTTMMPGHRDDILNIADQLREEMTRNE